MRVQVATDTWDDISFLGVLLGVALLVTSLFVGEWRVLAVPGLLVLFPSLVYGIR